MRLRPLTATVPKCLIPVGNKPLLQYHLEALAAAGVRRVVINLAWLGERIEEWAGDGSRFGLGIRYVREPEPENPLGTGGGALNALSVLGDAEFIVVNSDLWTDYPLSRLVERPLSGDDLAHLALVPPPQGSSGDFTLSTDGRLGVPEAGEAALTFSGISRLSPRLFADCKSRRFDLGQLLRHFAERGRISGERYDGRWSDLGTPRTLNELRARLAGNEEPSGL